MLRRHKHLIHVQVTLGNNTVREELMEIAYVFGQIFIILYDECEARVAL